MNQLGTMDAKQIQAATEAIFEAVARRLQARVVVEIRYGENVDEEDVLTWPAPQIQTLTAADVAAALEATLAEQFAPAGGVLLVWWDPAHGLRCNPASYAANGPPRRKGRVIRRDSEDQ